MFMKHIKVTLKKLNNWCPTKDYGETWDWRAKKRDVPPKSRWVATLCELYCIVCEITMFDRVFVWCVLLLVIVFMMCQFCVIVEGFVLMFTAVVGIWNQRKGSVRKKVWIR